MGRSSDIEAFARLLEGAPSSSVPASVASLGRTVSALRSIPAPATPAHLAGGLALMTKAGVAGTRIAGIHGAVGAGTAGTRIAASHAAGTAGTAGTRIANSLNVPTTAAAKTGAVAAKVTATKASLFGLLTAHLVPVVAGTALLAVGVTGVAVGASRSLPGDPLYCLKRATESVQTAAVSGKVALAERRLDLATTRLHEALALQQRGGSQAQLTSELHDWLTNESAALKVLTPLAGTPAVRGKLASFAAVNATALAEFPAAVVAPATAAVTTVTALLSPVTGKLPMAGTPTGVLPHVSAPSRVPNLPAPVPSLLPTLGRTTTPKRLPATVGSLPAVPTSKVKVPGSKLPTVTPASVVPSAALPSAALPTVLPSSLPTPVVAVPTGLPSIPAVTTLLQNLVPKP